MENTQIQTMLDSAAQEAAIQRPQPQPDDTELRLRAKELITQARTIQEITRVDVFSVYNTDVEVRSRILSGEMDFIDLYRQMKPAQQPPATVRSVNGGMGSVNISGMNDDQFARLNVLLTKGGKVSMA